MFFFSHLYLTIYFLSVKKTHTNVPYLFLFVVSLGSKLVRLECVKTKKKKNHMMAVQLPSVRATASLA